MIDNRSLIRNKEGADMGAWGIKALERDKGLDVLDILKNEYVPEHPVMIWAR